MTGNRRQSAHEAESEARMAVLDVLGGRSTEEDAAQAAGITLEELRAARDHFFRSKLPAGREELQDRGMYGSARVANDRWGVAHCYGDSVHDLFFAVGIAQAQDRLWQLDYRRRYARGELAEVMGSEALASDVANRTLGFTRAVRNEAGVLSPMAVEALEGYAAGVNTWIERVSDRLPFEFEVLGYQPTPWSPEDSLAILRHFWWTLTGRLQQLVTAERLLRHVDPEIRDWMLTPETVEHIVPGRTVPGDTEGAGAMPLDPETPGSNNWVAGPEITTTGSPVLAADPHWPLAFPDMWYEQHLAGAGFDCIGAAYPGAPPIIFGRTREVAWGRTNNVTSTRDLYHERVHPDDPEQYWTGRGWSRFDRSEEEVKVRGRRPVPLRIRRTERGPVVNELIPPVSEGGDGPITLRWVGHEPIGDLQALLDMNRATSADDLLAVLGRWRLSVWNAVYAGTDGSFGYQMCGSVPRRAVSTRGTRPAGESEHAWDGYFTTADLPGLRDPRQGWVASANNPPAEPTSGRPLYGAYADGYRYRRIRESLSTGDKLTPPAVAALQQDNLSRRALDLKGAVGKRLAATGDARLARAAEFLGRWNARYDPDQVGATLWAALWPRWTRRVGEAVLPTFVADLAAPLAARLARRLLLGDTPSFYRRDVGTELASAMRDALDYLTGALGHRMEGWRWGQAHRLHLRHPLARSASAARWLNPAPIDCPGGDGVINNRHPTERPEGFETSGGPSYRFAADMSESGLARGSLLAGQSGQPGSPHYADQTALWPVGELHPLLMDDDEIEVFRTRETIVNPTLVSENRE